MPRSHRNRPLQAAVERKLYATVLPMIRLSQIFVAAPLGLTLPQLLHGPPTTTAPKLRSRLRRVGHQIYTLIYYALLCYGLHLQYHYYDQFSDWMDAFLYAIRYMTYAVNVAIVVFGIHYRRAEYGILFQQFSCVDVHFMRLLVDEDAGNDNDTDIDNDDDDDDDSNRSDAAPTIPDCMLNTRLEFVNLQSRLRCGLAAFVTLVLSLSVINFYTQSAGWATSLLLIVCPNCTLGMCQIQLVFAMFWLRARFRLCAVLVQRRLGAGDGLLVETPGPRRLERTLLRLGRLHAQLTQINGALTRNFGLLLVGNVVSVSVVMTIVFYAIFRIASGSPAAGRARLDVPSVLYMLVWFLIYAVRVLPVLWHSARMRRDRRAVLEPLHLLECDAHRATSEAERRAIKQFSLQILNDVPSQMACGILQLDLTLLNSIVLSLTSYLVIVIQIDLSTPK